MWSTLNNLATATTVSSLLIVSASADAQEVCRATRDQPVAVCFDAVPLEVDHCGQTLAPHFSIDVYQPPDVPPVAYRYSYLVQIDDVAAGRLTIVGDPNDPTRFPFTGRKIGLFTDPQAYTGAAGYQLRVGVYVEGEQQEFAKLSPIVQLNDKPRVRGLAIGIAHYTNPELNLNYADADAAMFQDALTKLLTPRADVEIELRTSAMPGSDVTLSKDAIRKTLEDAEQGIRLCGPDDWFVFYYSGHGIVGVTPQQRAGRFLSTKSFDPRQLPRTALRLSELLLKLQDIGATNVLVVLDSCFSGSYTNSQKASATGARGIRQGPLPVRPNTSGKVRYAYDDQLQPVPPSKYQDGDAAALKRGADDLNGLGRHAWLLAAAGGAEEAEEGPVHYKGAAAALQLDFERGSIRENSAKGDGHGLFTYALLGSLQRQLPAGSESWLVPNGPPPASRSDCRLDFDIATTNAKVDISNLANERQWELQTPESHPSLNTPRPMACASAPARERP